VSLVSVWPLVAAFGAGAAQDAGAVDVVEVSGPIDRRLVSFVEEAITESEAVLVVLQIDSAAAVDGEARRLVDLVADPPVPVAVWVGPEPARAYGAAAQMLAGAPIRGAAPGVRVGYLAPTIAGSGEAAAAVVESFPEVPAELIEDRIEVDGPIPGLVDVVSPSIGQFVVGLDGTQLQVRGETATLATAQVTVADDGTEVITPSVDVRFRKPGLVDRTLRLAIQPEAAFLFLVAGLALVVFEFYAAGPGIAAAVGVASLLIAGYGLAVLPVNWWAVAAAVAGIGLYTADFQRNDLGWRSLAGTAALVYGGLRIVEAGPQMTVVWWPVAVVVVAAMLWFGFALTTVVRSRFATVTIGREHLVGKAGRAETDLDPEGVVVVDGARWRARARRAAAISAGDDVVVTAVEGIVLDVDPATTQ
jgi:membrane-bound serine protease (ClpP class)